VDEIEVDILETELVEGGVEGAKGGLVPLLRVPTAWS
jgi:hypothetical protein